MQHVQRDSPKAALSLLFLGQFDISFIQQIKCKNEKLLCLQGLCSHFCSVFCNGIMKLFIQRTEDNTAEVWISSHAGEMWGQPYFTLLKQQPETLMLDKVMGGFFLSDYQI